MSRDPDLATSGFRPSARRRNRIAAGVALGAVAIGGNLLVYSSLDDTTAAVQAIDNIPAGTQVTEDMFRAVEIDVDPSVPTVDADRLTAIVGQYAKVRIVSGQLVVPVAFQPTPLVNAGHAIVAIEVDADLVPTGVRERSTLQLVLIDDEGVTRSIPARATEVPIDSVSGNGTVSLSVEVVGDDAPEIATAEVVTVVLVPPTPDVEDR